jgi:4-amino-4-deoxy-L-arabinose transferase-like glycosyltransferase
MSLKLSLPRAVEQWFHNLGQKPALAVTVSVLWLLFIGWVAFGWNLGNIGLIDETEPLFAEASRQMLVTGDWITPFFNGETRFDKPALIYWCQAIAYAIMGVNEWAVRVPSALAALAAISLGFYTIQWYFAQKDELAGTSNPIRRYVVPGIAAAIMGLNPEMIVWGRTGVSDMLLTGCIASALFCFFLGYANQSHSNRGSKLPNKWYLAFYVLIAGAILTKGPVGIVLPGLVVIAFVLYVGKFWQVWREMRPILGIAIILALSMPWYALVIWRNGWNYINSFFGYHNLERFTEVVNGHSAPWYFYFVVVLLGFAPYSVYIPAALIKLKFWQRSHWRNQERSQQLGLFAAFWFLGVFIFFTIAVTKLPSYVLPLMPAAAILVALLLSDLFPSSETTTTPHPRPSEIKSFRISSWINVIFAIILAIALFNLSQIVGPDPAAPDLYDLIQKAGLPTFGGIIWSVAAIVIAALLLSYRWQPIIAVNIISFIAFLAIVLMPALFLMDGQRQLPLRQLSAIAVESRQTNEELVMVGFKKPSVTFYTQTTVNYIKFSKDALDYIQKQATKKPQPASLLLLAEQEKFTEMNLPPDDYKSISTKGAYHLVRIPLNTIKKEKLDIS